MQIQSPLSTSAVSIQLCWPVAEPVLVNMLFDQAAEKVCNYAELNMEPYTAY